MGKPRFDRDVLQGELCLLCFLASLSLGLFCEFRKKDQLWNATRNSHPDLRQERQAEADTVEESHFSYKVPLVACCKLKRVVVVAFERLRLKFAHASHDFRQYTKVGEEDNKHAAVRLLFF